MSIGGVLVNSRGYKLPQQDNRKVENPWSKCETKKTHERFVYFLRERGGCVRMAEACVFLKCSKKAFSSVMTGLSFYSPVIYHDAGEVGVL